MDAFFLGMLNTPEIIALLVLALILFGAKKLPELAKGLGHGIREFRKASREISDELNTSLHEDSAPPRQSSSSEPTPSPTSPEGTEPHSPDAYAAELNEDEAEAEKGAESTSLSGEGADAEPKSPKDEPAEQGTAGTDPESKPHVTKI